MSPDRFFIAQISPTPLHFFAKNAIIYTAKTEFRKGTDMKLTLSPSDALRVARLKKITEENDRILRLYANYLNLTPRLLNARTVRDLAADCTIPAADAFRALFSASIGLDVPDNPDDRRLERVYIQAGVRSLSPTPYRNDAYVKTVRFGDLSVGKWRFTHGEYHAFEPFVCGHPVLTSDFREIPQIGFFEERFSFPSVTENGVEWMTVTPNEAETMRAVIGEAHGRVLTYGLGLGYFTFHASQKPEVQSVTVIERDPDLIGLFRNCILPQFPNRDKITVLHADAFEFTERDMKPEAFDLAFVDIWHDQSDGLPLYLRMKRSESRFPATAFRYWIEPTLLSSLRHMVTDRIFDETAGAEVRTYGEIETMLGDDYLRALAPKLRRLE